MASPQQGSPQLRISTGCPFRPGLGRRGNRIRRPRAVPGDLSPDTRSWREGSRGGEGPAPPSTASRRVIPVRLQWRREPCVTDRPQQSGRAPDRTAVRRAAGSVLPPRMRLVRSGRAPGPRHGSGVAHPSPTTGSVGCRRVTRDRLGCSVTGLAELAQRSRIRGRQATLISLEFLSRWSLTAGATSAMNCLRWTSLIRSSNAI